MTAESAAAATTKHRTQYRRHLHGLGLFVDARVSELQWAYLKRRSDAVATLARLRRGVGKSPGSIPELWQATLEGVPQPPGMHNLADNPTVNEVAAHTALTLYAVHQQSRREGMHRPGQSLGTAVQTLSKRSASEDAVRRRFEALGTASTFDEVVHHARGLITQLRGQGIPLDYGEFADQMVDLQHAGGQRRVRLVWGRDFYQKTAEPAADPEAAGNEGALA